MTLDVDPAGAFHLWIASRARIRQLRRDGQEPPAALIEVEAELLGLLRDADRNANRLKALAAARSRRYRARKRTGQAAGGCPDDPGADTLATSA